MTSSEESHRLCPIDKRPEVSLKEQQILKKDIGVLPIWFGGVLWDESNFETLDRILNQGRQFTMYFPFVIPDADKIKDAKNNHLNIFAMDLQTVLIKIQHPLIIFAVSTAQSAERPWLDQFPRRLYEYRQHMNHGNDTFIYKIIMGGQFSNLNTEKTPHVRAWPQELRAHEHKGVYLHFDTDAPTTGFYRLVEFINRVVGVDLPGKEFPNYGMDDVKRIAWHINRESFNTFSEKVGSIPKYTIGSNGRPIFPF